MIIYGICKGPDNRYENIARPFLEAAIEGQDLVVVEDGKDGICAAYNRILGVARRATNCEAVVLLHDDLEIIDKNFRAKILDYISKPDVGILGVAGSSGLIDAKWWNGRKLCGRVFETRGLIDFGSCEGEVDVVDGMLMVLAPRVFENVSFSEDDFPRFHGYDVDICLKVKKLGLQVLVCPIDLFHRTKGGYGSTDEWEMASSRIREVHSRWIKPLKFGEKIRVRPRSIGKKIFRRLQRLRRNLASSEERGKTEGSFGMEAFVSQTLTVYCPVCERSFEIIAGGPPLIIECSDCGVGITVPIPTIDSESDLIFVNRYGGTRVNRRTTWMNEAQLRVNWVQLYQPEGIVLDVGCATGEFVEVARRSGFESVGVEASKWAFSQATTFTSGIILGSLSDFKRKFPGYRVDAVTMWHVLEHVRDPIELLVEARDVLTTTGFLFGELPNFGGSNSSKDPQLWEDSCPDDHVFHFREQGLELLLRKAGFSRVEIIPISKRIYLSNEQWLRLRNDRLRRNIDWPSQDFLRFVGQP